MKQTEIVPILLAAGSSHKLGFPKAQARFGEKTALEIAARNCVGLAPPIIVLGSDAAEVRKAAPRNAHVVLNRRWRDGQLSSLLAGLRKVPKGAAFMIYPIDHPLVTRDIVQRLVRAFRARSDEQTIIMPRFKRHPGHPVICEAEIRKELAKARTAREVVYRKRRRIRYVVVRSAGVYLDFGTPKTYLECLLIFGSTEKRADRASRIFS